MKEDDTPSHTAVETLSASDWTGNDDAGNPHNWSVPRKFYISTIPTIFGFLCTFGSSIYTPGTDDVRKDFHVSREVALLPFCFYLLGLSFGPVIAAPISEAYGRKVVYLFSLPISGLFTLGAGFSKDVISLTFCRFFAALFCSPGLTIGTGTVADVFPPEKRQLPMAAFVASVQMGPALGPLIGGLLVSHKSWRWTQWTMLFALASVLAGTLPMSETYKKTILQRRAKKAGIKGPVEPQRSILESVRFFLIKTIARPVHMLVTETIVTLFGLYVAVNFSLLNAFFAAFPYVFQKQYGFDLIGIGFTFLAQAVGSISGLIIVTVYNKYYYEPAARRRKDTHPGSKLPPEQRLWIAMIGAPMLPISLFWFGWTARPAIHWISPVISEALFSCGNLLIFTTTLLYLTDCYGAVYGASASSSNTLLRYTCATGAPLFVIQMYERMGIGWATTLLGFLELCLTPIPFVFYRYGEYLRRNSKYQPGE